MSYDSKAGRPLRPSDLVHDTPSIPSYVYDAFNACIATNSHHGSKHEGVRVTRRFVSDEIRKRAPTHVDAGMMAHYLDAAKDYEDHGWEVSIEEAGGLVITFVFKAVESDAG